MLIDTRSGLTIEKFLSENFLFRRRQIDEFICNKPMPVLWTERNDREYLERLDNTQDPCELLAEGFFSNWPVFNNDGVKKIYDELLYRQIWSRAKIKANANEIKSTIKYLVRETNVTKTIIFNPLLKQVVAEGRHHVKGVTPLGRFDPRRTNVNAKKGDKLYICKSNKPPYIANPCYVLEASGNNSYRVMFFTNLDADCAETKARNINGWGFVPVDGNEAGRTPEEAVLQNKY